MNEMKNKIAIAKSIIISGIHKRGKRPCGKRMKNVGRRHNFSRMHGIMIARCLPGSIAMNTNNICQTRVTDANE